MTPFEAKAEHVLARAYRGIHHVRFWSRRHVAPDGRALSVSIYPGISTFDGDELTRLVVAAHEECCRIEIHPGGPGLLKLWLSERVRDGSIYDSHPTIEQAVEFYRMGRR